jgi:hypothetical protein
MTPHDLADAILKAAGSRLAHYTTHSRQLILNAAFDAVEKMARDERLEDAARRAIPVLDKAGFPSTADDLRAALDRKP